jgi:hypothetical protein
MSLKWIDPTLIPDIRTDYPDECYFLSDQDLDDVWKIWVGENNSTSNVDLALPGNTPDFSVTLTMYLRDVKKIQLRNRKEIRSAKKKFKGNNNGIEKHKTNV